MALAGFPNIHGLVTPAALPEAIIRKLDKSINTVFPFVTFTAFTDEKGKLAPVLEMLLASFLHRWNEMLEDNPTSSNCDIMHHLLAAAMDVKSTDARQAVAKLGEWSKTIDKNFMLSNALALGLGNNTKDMAENMKSFSSVLREVLSELKSVKSELADVKRSVQNVSSDVHVAAFSPAKAEERPAVSSESSSSESARTFSSSSVDFSLAPGNKKAKPKKEPNSP